MEEQVKTEEQIVGENVDSILKQTEQKTKDQYKDYVLGKFREKMIYPILDGGCGPEQIKFALEKVQSSGIDGVLMLPGYLPYAKKQVGAIKNVGVAIGYPFGEDGDSVKLIKSLAKAPVNYVVCVLSVSDLKFNKCKRSEKILKVLSALKKRKQLRVGVMVDTAKFSPAELTLALKKISAQQIDDFYTSTAIYKDGFSLEVFDSVKVGLGGKFKMVSSNMFTSQDELSQAINVADYVVSQDVLELLSSLKNKINI